MNRKQRKDLQGFKYAYAILKELNEGLIQGKTFNGLNNADVAESIAISAYILHIETKHNIVIDLFRKCYYKLMKKNLTVLAALVVVLVCLSIAIVRSNDRKADAAAVQNSQVKSLKSQLSQADVRYKVDSLNLTNANTQITTLANQKNILCVQIKAARLAQPLCP